MYWHPIKRHLSTNSQCFKSVKLKTSKGTSSNQWLTRQLSDPYVEKAKIMNYRCRSAFKLLEIDEKSKIFKPGQTVVDCGAAPGSWTQVAVKKVNSDGSAPDLPRGNVISVDLQQIYPIKGATILGNSDFTSPETQEKVLQVLQGHKPDVIVSDMAPKATGVRDLDNYNIVHLCYAVLRFGVQISEIGGCIVVKLWQCGQMQQLQSEMKRFYDSVKVIKPNSSRADSAEVFLLGRSFKGLEVK